MAKSLGQIHTVNYQLNNAASGLAATQSFLIDLPGELTKQLQHMVRMMSSFKVVGIDLALDPFVGQDNITASMSGKLQYFAPTKGRVEALKMAYHSVRRMMKLSGVDPSNNASYDFRPPLVDPLVTGLDNVQNGASMNNQASIEDNGLATCLVRGGGSSNIFGLYNQGILPRDAVGAPTFMEAGFDIGLRSNADSSDWTLREYVTLQNLSHPTASEEFEVIPFDVAYSSPDGTGLRSVVADEFLWRPDPALYLSVLTGQFLLTIDSIAAFDSAGTDKTNSISLSADFHVAGWKGILGNKKRRSSKKKSRRHQKKR